jgi:hypothetical protein
VSLTHDTVDGHSREEMKNVAPTTSCRPSGGKEHVLDDWPSTHDVLRCVIIEWSQVTTSTSEMRTARLRIEDLIDLVESRGFHQPIKAGQEWEFA